MIKNILSKLPKVEVKNDVDCENVAIIIDPRYDETMRQVINNFATVLNDKWNFEIYSGLKHKEQIKKDFPNVEFHSLEKYDYARNGNMTINDYNELLMNNNFWYDINYENILIFQKDCFCFNEINEGITDYSYAGAEFGGSDVTPQNRGINGGCSFRKKSAMMRCLRYVDWDMISCYRLNHNKKEVKQNEDVFFTHACEILGEKIPTMAVNQRNFVECLTKDKKFNIRVSFIHGWDKPDNGLWGDRPSEENIELILKKSILSKYI